MSEALAIVTSGGDSAGMSPAVKCVADYAKSKGYRPFLIYRGLRGLLEDRIEEATPQLLSGVLHKGGTFLGSSRSKRFFEYEYRLKAYENLKRKGINKLVVIGGDGSFQAFNQFYSDFQVPFAGIPATIDNDIPGTDYCLGVDTALNVIRQSVDSIRDTASAFSRGFVVEVMGRNCGYLAMMSALTSGAEVCLVPEMEYDLNSLANRLHDEKAHGSNYMIAIVAEGTGMGEYLTRWMRDSLKMDARLTVLGHVQRGGSPTVRDRIMAYKFAVSAVDSLAEGHTNRIIAYREGSFEKLPIDEVTGAKHKVDSDLMQLCEHLMR